MPHCHSGIAQDGGEVDAASGEDEDGAMSAGEGWGEVQKRLLMVLVEKACEGADWLPVKELARLANSSPEFARSILREGEAGGWSEELCGRYRAGRKLILEALLEAREEGRYA